MAALELVFLDVNGTLSDLEPLRERFSAVGAPGHLLETWFAGTLRDGFALAAAGTAQPFRAVADAVLRGLLSGLESLSAPVGDAAGQVLDAMPGLPLHPDVAPGLAALAEAGLRVVTLTNGAAAQTEQLLEHNGVADLVERCLSVDDAGRWKPHPDAYGYGASACTVPLSACALVAVHPWDLGGAARAGLTSSWLDRTGTPWPAVFPEPDLHGADLADLARQLRDRRAG